MIGQKTAIAVSFLAMVGLICLVVQPRHPDGMASRANSSALVEFYGESLCPDCRHMVLDVLAPLYENGVAQLMHLKYIAYGKVKDGQCQHGTVECKYNRYINCAQSLHGDSWFPYVQCLAKNLTSIATDAPGCAETQGWDASELDACAGGARGEALGKEAGEATTQLQPALTNVPWVIVNGVPVGKDFENLDRYLCAAAGGPGANRPSACADLTDNTRFG
uniref:Gamma-interferon-inducible lysosomal thiol reductase n=2 Tax=Auxenochlorella protothecoides TaxID=3075 RepID=A0A1D2A1E0_AUXPR